MNAPLFPSEMNVGINAARVPMVFHRNGEVFTNSRHVAEYFEKRHDNVMRDIGGLLRTEDTLGLRHFTQTTQVDQQNGQSYRSYDMNRRGFMLLVMSFTGPKALKWKMTFLDAFDAMEDELRSRPVATLTRTQKLAEALLIADEELKEQAAEIAVLKPKAEALDRISMAEGSLCLRDAAKALQTSEKHLIKYLSTHGWIYKRNGVGKWIGYSVHTANGNLEHKVTPVPQQDGSEKLSKQVRVTPSGLIKLAQIVPGVSQGQVH